MAYVPLSLSCADTRVSAAMSMATERHLKDAHYLLAATYGHESPHDHFGNAAAIMTLLAIAAASAIRHFDPKANKNKRPDRQSFVECVEAFFPWDHVGIADDQHRSPGERRSAAAAELYSVFRNPLVHCGGVVGKGHRLARINHVFPGLGADASTVHTRPLYWCARRMIESLAADPAVQNDVVQNLGIKPAHGGP